MGPPEAISCAPGASNHEWTKATAAAAAQFSSENVLLEFVETETPLMVSVGHGWRAAWRWEGEGARWLWLMAEGKLGGDSVNFYFALKNTPKLHSKVHPSSGQSQF